jgi:serine/threonine protein kinase
MLALAPHCPHELLRKTHWSLADFVLVKKLGVGGASAVYKGYLKGTSTTLAVKMYFKSKMTQLNMHQVRREVCIHAQLDHPNVITLVRP